MKHLRFQLSVTLFLLPFAFGGHLFAQDRVLSSGDYFVTQSWSQEKGQSNHPQERIRPELM